jgi:hypothetical protein
VATDELKLSTKLSGHDVGIAVVLLLISTISAVALQCVITLVRQQQQCKLQCKRVVCFKCASALDDAETSSACVQHAFTQRCSRDMYSSTGRQRTLECNTSLQIRTVHNGNSLTLPDINAV